jgi:hypothetical protein
VTARDIKLAGLGIFKHFSVVTSTKELTEQLITLQLISKQKTGLVLQSMKMLYCPALTHRQYQGHAA